MRSCWEVRHPTARLAGAILLSVSAAAWAQSNVTYQLELGGDNHAARWKLGPPFTADDMFTSGSTDNDQVYSIGESVTWAVRLAAGGVQASGPGAGHTIKGVANFVFDLKLFAGVEGGPLATAAIFESTINDGTPSWNGNYTAAAAFPLIYDLDSAGPGRIVDPRVDAAQPLNGGPLCGGNDIGRYNRLRSATYPLNTPFTGMLVGMGAGYSGWASSGVGKTTWGIGIPTEQGGLGIKPVCEGQINTGGMTPGTYTLAVYASSSATNVLRGDLDLDNTSPYAFVTKADTTTGSSIRLILTNSPGPATDPYPPDGTSGWHTTLICSWLPGFNATSYDVYLGTQPDVLTRLGEDLTDTSFELSGLSASTTYYWRVDAKNAYPPPTPSQVWSFTTRPPYVVTACRSLQTHASQSRGVSLLPGPVSDPRSGSVQVVEIEFNETTDFGDLPTVTGNDGSHPPFNYEFFNENRLLRLTFVSPLPSGKCYTLDLSTVFSMDSFQYLEQNSIITFRVLPGDTNSNGVVNLGDALYIRANQGTVSDGNARFDMNLDGVIDDNDVIAAKGVIGAALTCP